MDSLIGWVTDSLLRCFTDSMIHWFIDSLIRLFLDSLTHWFIESCFVASKVTDSLLDWFIALLFHWCTDSLRHWFFESSILWFIGSPSRLCMDSFMSSHVMSCHVMSLASQPLFAHCWCTSQLQHVIASASQKNCPIGHWLLWAGHYLLNQHWGGAMTLWFNHSKVL